MCCCISRLLLECTGQIFYVFLLLYQVYVHCLRLRTKPCVFISCNIVLDLHVAIHIPEVLFLGLAEDGRLIGLHHVRAVRSLVYSHGVILSPTKHRLLTYRLLSGTTKQDIARTVIMNDLLIHATAFGTLSSTAMQSVVRYAVHAVEGRRLHVLWRHTCRASEKLPVGALSICTQLRCAVRYHKE